MYTGATAKFKLNQEREGIKTYLESSGGRGTVPLLTEFNSYGNTECVPVAYGDRLALWIAQGPGARACLELKVTAVSMDQNGLYVVLAYQDGYVCSCTRHPAKLLLRSADFIPVEGGLAEAMEALETAAGAVEAPVPILWLPMHAEVIHRPDGSFTVPLCIKTSRPWRSDKGAVGWSLIRMKDFDSLPKG